jgi:hypothetical protein
MPAEHEQSFSADSPVGRYWLLNCIGFRVEGARGHAGIVEEVGLGPDGVDVLAVRRRGPLWWGVVLIPATRVAWVHPWDDTIVLASHSRRSRERRQRRIGPVVDARAQELGRRLKPIGTTAAVAAGRSLRYGAAAVREGGAIVIVRLLAAAGTVLLGLTELARKHAPGARRAAKNVASIALLIARAYASEARRLVREEQDAIRAWRESRRVRDDEPAADDGPLTRAGADAEVDARRREGLRR